MRITFDEECRVLLAATTLLAEEHERVSHKKCPSNVRAVHVEKLHLHVKRLSDFVKRLHAEHQRLADWDLSASSQRELERLVGVRAISEKSKRPRVR